jgi:leader peptidase (prepilin peptidase)/N-methyltransferase
LVVVLDLRIRLIPDVISLPGLAYALGLAALTERSPTLLQAALGALVGGGLVLLVAIVSRGGMGGGDIKLMAMVGGFLGWKAVILTTFLGSLFGSVIGIGLIALKGRERGSLIPFGPFLALGTIVSLFFVQEILMWYLY